MQRKIEHWYQGQPPVEIVQAHQSLHITRHDGVILPEITVGRVIERATYVDREHDHDKTEIVYLKADGRLYGDWLVQHRGGPFDYIGLGRLKVVDGEIIYAIGFCQWGRLSDCVGATASMYFPVGANGLPLSFKPE